MSDHDGLPGPEIVGPLLVEINRIRKRLRLPSVRALLPGRRKHALACPISRTLALGTDPKTHEIEVMNEQVKVYLWPPGRLTLTTLGRCIMAPRLSRETRLFIQEFDAGSWPGLEAR